MAHLARVKGSPEDGPPDEDGVARGEMSQNEQK